MLATLAALQLVLLTQVGPPPREVTPDEPPAPTDESVPPAAQSNPPLPSKPGARPAGGGDSAAGAAASPASPASPARPRQLSLLSGESLGGASTAMAWAGWKSIGAAYAQGVTSQDDLGAFFDLDWSTAELRVGGLYRRPLGQAGAFDMAGRLSLAWYQNFAATWIRSENHSDRGVELVPGLSLSQHLSGGIFSILGEFPMIVTTKYGSGFLVIPRVSVAYEAPLYQEVTLGARAGIGYRAGSGDAPLKDGQADFLFLVTATYQLL